VETNGTCGRLTLLSQSQPIRNGKQLDGSFAAADGAGNHQSNLAASTAMAASLDADVAIGILDNILAFTKTVQASFCANFDIAFAVAVSACGQLVIPPLVSFVLSHSSSTPYSYYAIFKVIVNSCGTTNNIRNLR
jgi:hypothetical protein